MDGRNHCRTTLCALAVALATGCTSLPGVRPGASLPPPEPRGKFVPRTNDNQASETGVKPAGAVVPAGAAGAGGGVVPAGGQAPPVPVTTVPGPATLPTPKPSATPTTGPAGPGCPAPTAGTPGGAPGTPGTPGLFMLPDPTVRTMPTATGARLNLGPAEGPTDRVVELSQNLDAALAQNRDLVGRIRELEALGVAREQALVEALGEVEIAAAEVARTRAALQALQAKLLMIETEDIETLKAVIAALERLISPPAPGRKEP